MDEVTAVRGHLLKRAGEGPGGVWAESGWVLGFDRTELLSTSFPVTCPPSIAQREMGHRKHTDVNKVFAAILKPRQGRRSEIPSCEVWWFQLSVRVNPISLS